MRNSLAKRTLTLFFASGLIWALCFNTAAQQRKNSRAKAPLAAEQTEKYRPWSPMPDAWLLNEDGEKISFSDVVKDRLVVINFVFTACQYRCPMQARKFAELQEALGDRSGRDVWLISLSRDPENDSPEKMKAWGKSYRAKPGWTFLTGDKAEVDKVFLALMSKPATGRMDHGSIILIGKGNGNGWTKLTGMYGLSPIPEIIAKIDDLDKQAKQPSN